MKKKLVILHSNDMHGDFMAEEVDSRLVGGVSRLSGYVNKVRSEEKNVIYAISGDMFRGSIIDAEYRGMSTIEIMNMLSPDVVTIGNHEIDYGIAHLLFIEKCAKFPIINANLFIKTNGARLFKPYLVERVGGMNVLFIGIITEEVLAQAKQDPLIGSFIDTAEAAHEVKRICNAHRSTDIDLTVLLTHIGFENDKKLAAIIDPSCGVDVIIGGHSHTKLERPEKVNDILIVQAGTGTDYIGRFDITVDTDTNSVDSYEWEMVPIDANTCPRDTQLEEIIEKYKKVTDEKYSRIITRFNERLTHPQRNKETALGNLFADIFKNSLGVDIMLLGSGSIRNEFLGPIVEYGSLKETFPYDDAIYMMKLTGAQLRHAVKFILRDEAFSGTTEFYQISEGIKVVYSKTAHEFRQFTFNGEEVGDGGIFSVGLQSFHFSNLESFLDLKYADIEKVCKPRVVTTSCLDVLEEYLSEHQKLHGGIDGRIEIVD